MRNQLKLSIAKQQDDYWPLAVYNGNIEGFRKQQNN
jgi:hypothetical protein